MSTETPGRSGPFIPLTSTASLDELFQLSIDGPVILFKHSLTCPISSAAYEEMKQSAHDVALVVLQSSRDVSADIERRTGVRHETPQVLVLRNGAAVWSASHWAIKADAVEVAFLGAE